MNVCNFLKWFYLRLPIWRHIVDMDRLQKATLRAAYKIRQRLHQTMNIAMEALLKVLNFVTVCLIKKLSTHSQYLM